MKKHAASHGLAVLVCTVIAGILVHMGKDYLPFLTDYVDKFSRYIIYQFGLDYPPKAISTLLVAFVLAMIWGIFFKMMHTDQSSDRDKAP